MSSRTRRSPALRRELAAMARARLNQRRMWRTGYRAACYIGDTSANIDAIREKIAKYTVDVKLLVMAGKKEISNQLFDIPE